mmetsp:Transcript_21034/g.62787  ORF Transcript_21034/g.62787 Transcript_21034/m.62787 type:complete len:286 (+) Transcript_21034:23-880(+)
MLKGHFGNLLGRFRLLVVVLDGHPRSPRLLALLPGRQLQGRRLLLRVLRAHFQVLDVRLGVLGRLDELHQALLLGLGVGLGRGRGLVDGLLAVQHVVVIRRREVVDVPVGALLEALEQLGLDGLAQLGGRERLGLLAVLAPLDLFVDHGHLRPVPERELAHALQVLVDARQPLLVPVLEVFREVLELLGHARERRRVVARQLDLLPEARGHVRALDGLDHQVAAPVDLPDRRVPRVRQRAGRLVAEAGDVLLVAAEVLRLHLGLEGAEAALALACLLARRAAGAI